jgi:hypothetical protein
MFHGCPQNSLNTQDDKETDGSVQAFNQIRKIVSWRVDQRRDRIHLHEVGGVRLVEVLQLSFLAPFKKPVCRDDAAAVTDCLAKGRLFVDRLGTGIDHPAADGGGLCPGGNKAPKHEGGPIARVRPPDREDLLGRGDVVSPGEIFVDRNPEDPGKQFRGYVKGEASAHGDDGSFQGLQHFFLRGNKAISKRDRNFSSFRKVSQKMAESLS